MLYVSCGIARWLRGKGSACQHRRCGFNPWVRKIPLEKEMATHSSILAWRIPWTEEPGGLQSMGSQKSQTQLNTRAHAHMYAHTHVCTHMHTHSTIPYVKIGSFLPYSKSFSLGGRETFGRKRNSTKPVPPNTLLKKKKKALKRMSLEI